MRFRKVDSLFPVVERSVICCMQDILFVFDLARTTKPPTTKIIHFGHERNPETIPDMIYFLGQSVDIRTEMKGLRFVCVSRRDV